MSVLCPYVFLPSFSGTNFGGEKTTRCRRRSADRMGLRSERRGNRARAESYGDVVMMSEKMTNNFSRGIPLEFWGCLAPCPAQVTLAAVVGTAPYINRARGAGEHREAAKGKHLPLLSPSVQQHARGREDKRGRSPRARAHCCEAAVIVTKKSFQGGLSPHLSCPSISTEVSPS